MMTKTSEPAASEVFVFNHADNGTYSASGLPVAEYLWRQEVFIFRQ
jgi:hypothetical protein